MPGNNPSAIEQVVVLTLENRSFAHMLGFLYAGTGNVSAAGQPFEGLTGNESNPGALGQPIAVSRSTRPRRLHPLPRRHPPRPESPGGPGI